MVAVVLYVAKPVVIPLALAVLLAFVLSPLVAAAQRAGLNRTAAVGLTVLVAFLAVGGTGWLVGHQIQSLAAELPKHKKEIRDKIDRVRGSRDGPFGELLKMARDLTEGPAESEHIPAGGPPPGGPPPREVVVAQPKESALAYSIEAAAPVVEPLAQAGLVVVLVVFVLANKEDVRDRLVGMAGHGRLSRTTRAMDDAAGRVGKYLLSLLGLNVAFGVVLGVGLWVIGVPYASLWGFLAAVLRFVPFLGVWLAAAFPVLLSVALAPDWAQPLQVIVFIVVVDLIVTNAVEPLLFGHGTGVSPIALLVAAAFWAWLWGPVGLLLSTPLTVCLVVLGQHVPRLGFLSLLLGNAPALSPPAGLYQRLLARDRREAGERVADYAAANGAEAAFDDVVVPALVLARRDRDRGGLTPEGEEFALDAVRDIVAGVDLKVPAEATAHPSAVVVACAAHHPAEEPTLEILARLAVMDGLKVEVLPARTLPSDVMERVGQVRPAAVFVSVLPPGGLPQAAYLCRLFRKRFPELPVVVGWWGSERNFDTLLVKLRKAGASYVTTSLRQSRTQLRFVATQSAAVRNDGAPARLDPAPGVAT